MGVAVVKFGLGVAVGVVLAGLGAIVWWTYFEDYDDQGAKT